MSTEELAAQARDTRVVIIGGGISGLVAALECAKVGMRVTVVEASDRFGGVVRSAELGGLTVDVGAESYATRGGHVRALIDELGLGDAVTAPAAGAAWVAGLPGGRAAPLPGGGILGIPANPWAEDVRRVIGWRGAWRAYLDRLRPPLTIGHERSLGRLVRSRMGPIVLDRLVAPVTTGVYSARPDDIDVDAAAPGLNGALTRAGSLSGAVAAVRAEGAAQAGAKSAAAPGAAVAGLVGGMTRLVDALEDRLRALGADLRRGVRVECLERGDAGEWTVRIAEVDDGADAADPAPDVSSRFARSTTGADPAPDVSSRFARSTTGDSLSADIVVVATSEAVARRILAPVVPALGDGPAAAPIVEVVTLLVDAPALDANPRGTGVLTVPGTGPAKALTHSTAKWQWLRAATPHHILRVSFGAQGEAPATEALGDADAADLALTEAAALLGVDLPSSCLRAAHRERYEQSQPAATLGRAQAVAAARSAIREIDGLGAVGAWLSGTGLAQVVPDAAGEADRLRRAALFGGDTVSR